MSGAGPSTRPVKSAKRTPNPRIDVITILDSDEENNAPAAKRAKMNAKTRSSSSTAQQRGKSKSSVPYTAPIYVTTSASSTSLKDFFRPPSRTTAKASPVVDDCKLNDAVVSAETEAFFASWRARQVWSQLLPRRRRALGTPPPYVLPSPSVTDKQPPVRTDDDIKVVRFSKGKGKEKPEDARQLKKHTDAKARADKAKLEQQEKKERKSQRDAKVRAPSSVVTDPVQRKELKKRLDAESDRDSSDDEVWITGVTSLTTGAGQLMGSPKGAVQVRASNHRDRKQGKKKDLGPIKVTYEEMYGPEKNNEVPLDDKQQEDAANAADAPARLLTTSGSVSSPSESASSSTSLSSPSATSAGRSASIDPPPPSKPKPDSPAPISPSSARTADHDSIDVLDKIAHSLEYIYRQRNLNLYFETDLNSTSKRNKVANDVLANLAPGALQILADGRRLAVPPI
ncbi:hypothetical protein A1Q1_05559 [Trichosporon asahii var. asahii CBS 2479]|uniref:Uncharacterized protein n=1 Tax=Trichosporon asahii var. asahii (strain ATCC 90039 / CBS 2479 / JCM 2466 / KCTC 7840 / NBRC 103889/ NCYC 2677 / UAMH 7654) TaxID=1186058 RepID=J5Q8G5_TRIAS|nr:hypothetical protein A1Q1_05559 [Trichosporon asahii var. asahii CBS 2479]EJT46013.1 hypothetical protein A1Q1_05559 [Trichosporon asahii var. asahii CBS 2479]